MYRKNETTKRVYEKTFKNVPKQTLPSFYVYPLPILKYVNDTLENEPVIFASGLNQKQSKHGLFRKTGKPKTAHQRVRSQVSGSL